ncbi:hypothetical protein UTI89UKE1_064 [Escherichia phage vB_EcoS-UTI89UKE1]|uniref:Uncharacterized protein n=1 Tax=Escherichia phage vB_EcoS-UTI89UKE1 TaxID=2865825 RepID=A0A9E7MNB2_9CAUD|nr:hypothetical protein UTI89UKE1_064 [Escherichia phage vB_EcoS-UTI89UKE1]
MGYIRKLTHSLLVPSAPRSFRFARYPIKLKNHNGNVTNLLHAPT